MEVVSSAKTKEKKNNANRIRAKITKKKKEGEKKIRRKGWGRGGEGKGGKRGRGERRKEGRLSRIICLLCSSPTLFQVKALSPQNMSSRRLERMGLDPAVLAALAPQCGKEGTPSGAQATPPQADSLRRNIADIHSESKRARTKVRDDDAD